MQSKSSLSHIHIVLLMVSSFVVTGCAFARTGGEFMFGETNPYGDPEIEAELDPEVAKQLHSSFAPTRITLTGVATPVKFPEESQRCLKVSGDDSLYCVSTVPEERTFGADQEAQIYINHPYFTALRETARLCELPSQVTIGTDARSPLCESARAQLVHLYLDTADRACIQRLAAIGSGQASTNLFLRFTNITSSAVATFAGVASTARWLAALSLASSETGALLDDEVFGRAINYAMANKIVEAQESTRTIIQAGLKKPMNEYSIDQALNHAKKYNRECSYAYGQKLVAGLADANPEPDQLGKLQTRLDKLREMRSKVNAELTGLASADKKFAEFTNLSTADKKAAIAEREAQIKRLNDEINWTQDQWIAHSRP